MTDRQEMSGAVIAPGLTCPFCHAPWAPENVQLFELDAGDHCDSGRFYGECCNVSITCHACNREMYRKEGAEFGWKDPAR